MRLIAAIITIAFWFAAPARAEVTATSASTFTISAEAVVSETPERAWRELTRIQNWWGSSHTYSGDSSRLRLEPRAGGCWCERWGDGQSVEHMRVVLVMEHEGVRTLRASGGLGPLQAMAANGVLTFTVAPDPAGAKISMTYLVSGDPSLRLEQIAPIVDGVLTEQFGRLTRFMATGTPD